MTIRFYLPQIYSGEPYLGIDVLLHLDKCDRQVFSVQVVLLKINLFGIGFWNDQRAFSFSLLGFELHLEW